MKNQTMYISMLLWLHTYFSLNSVLLCAAFTYREDKNNIDMEMLIEKYTNTRKRNRLQTL